MSRNNDVSKVMVLPGVGPKTGININALNDGEWGVFDYDTGNAINTAPATTDPPLSLSNFFFAYMGDGTLGTPGEIYTSAGTHLQARNVRYASCNKAEDAVGQEIVFDGFNIQSGPDATQYDYGIKFDFRGNTEVYQRFGYNQATKFFMGNTRCVGQEGTPAVFADAEVVAQWAAAIAADTDKFLGLATTGSGGLDVDYVPNEGWTIGITVVTEEAALDEIRNYTADVKFTAYIQDFSAMYRFCDVNPKYFKQRQIVAIPSLLGGSCKWGNVEETVSMKYEQGTGYDIQELEYLAGGFTGKPGPYRQSRLHGLAFNDVEFLATKTGKYDVSVLSYDQFSVGGWLEYLNSQSTYFVEPKGAINVKTVIAAIADAVGASKGLATDWT